MKTFADFRAFSQAGRDFAHWHLNYETVACHPGVVVEELVSAPAEPARRYRVTKMKFGKTKDASGKRVNDKSTVIYNEYITLKNIPLAAYDYVVNGKPALEWVMERQCVTQESGDKRWKTALESGDRPIVGRKRGKWGQTGDRLLRTKSETSIS